MAVLYMKYVEGGIPVLIHGVLCVVAYIIWFLFVVVLLPFMIVFRFYKLLVKALISYQRLGTVFATVDIPFLHESENNRNFIFGLVEVKGEIKVEKLRRRVFSRLFNKKRELHQTYKRLSQRIERRYFSYVWKDEENFNIKQHIPLYKGPLPKTKEDTEKLFTKFTEDPFPTNISPWMFRLIPKEDKKGFLLFCKIHHTIGDGFAMIGLLSQLVDEKPTFVKMNRQRSGFMSKSIKRVVTGILTGPLAMLTLIPPIAIWNPFLTKETPEKKCVSWTLPISLELVKKLKTKTGTTVNDVLMSCLAGALRIYLEEVNIENPKDLPIAMTFNSRSKIPNNTDKLPLGNNSGGLLLNLPVSIEDPIKRLYITQKRINVLKSLSHPQLFSFVYFNIVGGLPDYFGRLSTYSVKKHASLIFSNVPGPIKPLNILGLPVESIIFMPPLHADMGLVVSIFSYNNWLRLSVLCGDTIIADPSRLTKAFEQEVSLLGERVLIDD